MSVLVAISIMRDNPYSHTVGEVEFREILEEAFVARAQHIEQWYDEGIATRNSFAFCLLDPTASASASSDDSILATAVIGPEGQRFLPNAIAKVLKLRDNDGLPLGALLMSQSHRLADGDFRWDGAVCVDGTYVGGSGLAVPQDRYQNGRLALSFNYRIQTAKAVWDNEHPMTGEPSWSWFCNENKPGERYDLEEVLARHAASHEWSCTT